MFAIGIDIGGTNTRVGLVSDNGVLQDVRQFPTDSTLLPELFFELIMQQAQPFFEKASSIGIAIAGQTDKNRLLFAPNLGWKNVDIAHIIKQYTKLSVTLENDVRASLIAEAAFGEGRDSKNVLLLALGTGLGGAAIVNGTLLQGNRGTACEVGHLCINPEGRACSCGGRGCLEAYVGGWAIKKESGGLSPEVVFSEAKKGNENCQKIINEVIVTLGAGVASLLNLLNPEVVIFTGGIFNKHPDIITSVQKEAEQRALPTATQQVEWRTGTLEHSGVIGSALKAMRLS